MRLFYLFLLFSTAILNGCAHTCATETFFKASLVAPSAVRTGGNNRFLNVFPQGETEFRVFECGTAYRKSDVSPSLICIDWRINEGTEVSFVSHDFQFRSADGKILGVGSLKEPALVLRGGRESAAPAIARALSDAQNWKRYVLNVEPPAFSATGFTMQIPPFLINGQSSPQFEIKFQRVTESVCHLSV